ncbi:MAG: aspartyl/asparaginyl beta-hydroxylase domain-containing protein [Pseudomonadota bacterium]
MTEPPSAKTAISNAQHMVRAGDVNGALEVLRSAQQADPRNLDVTMNLAMVHRSRGELQDAIRALDAALAIEPYSFLALLSKGSVYEQLNAPRQAAEVYRNAIKIAPAGDQLPPSLQAPVARAREVVEQQSQAMADFLREGLTELLGSTPDTEQQRASECIDVVAGVKKVFNAEPVQVHYPRLPAIPFFDRSFFPWFETLEAATDTIREELLALLNAGLPGFSPYVAYAPGTPENQFATLNHSDDWRSLWLWKDGEAQREAMAQCPKTTALLEELPLCDQGGFAPTALFSALAPHTRIPAHTGSTNTRLLVHLPLVLPGPAGFRVGNETRTWKLGEAWAFDDTIEHEAWNDADETRVIMIFDIWNPLLSEDEKEIVRSLLTKQREWLGG